VDLRLAWVSVQADLKLLDEGQRRFFVAMKDHYKRMIERGEIKSYLKIRLARLPTL